MQSAAFLIGRKQRFVPSRGNIKKVMWVFNCLGRLGRFGVSYFRNIYRFDHPVSDKEFLKTVIYVDSTFNQIAREEEGESRKLLYDIMTASFWPFDFNQGYFNQFEVLESQKWPLVDKTKSFYIKSALSFPL